MKFIKVGTQIINPDHIVRATLFEDHVCLTMAAVAESDKETYEGSEDRLATSVSEVLLFQGKAAWALMRYLEHPDHTQDLLPSEDVEAFQAYRQRGGGMSYDSFLESLARHKRLNEIESPTERQYDQLSQLEHDLLY